MLRNLYLKLPWVVQPVAKAVYEWWNARPFYKIKSKCNGYFHSEIYELFFEYAEGLEDGNILEIGAAHGAATVSFAMGLQKSGANGAVVAVEKGEGGSMDKFGSKEHNISTLESNLADFGVADKVCLVKERLVRDADVPEVIQQNAPYSLLLLDADGWIDRDIQLLYEYLTPGAVVMIDDFSPQHPRDSSKSKFYKTFWLANELIERGYLMKYESIMSESHSASMLIAAKPPHAPEFDSDDLKDIQSHLISVSQTYEDRESWLNDQIPIE